MSLWSDFQTFPLPDLLQWVEAGRHSGVLLLEGGLPRRLRFYRGVITGFGSERLVELTVPLVVCYGFVPEDAAAAGVRIAGEDFARWMAETRVDSGALARLLAQETADALFDVIAAPEGRFEFRSGDALEDETWLPMELELRGLLLDAMRHLDEEPEVSRLFPAENAIPTCTAADSSGLGPRERMLLSMVKAGKTVGEMRWALRTSSLAIRRRLFDLARGGFVLPPSGEAIGPDPIGRLIEQGLVLLRERQFNEVAHVFESLQGIDQGDRRVTEFLRHIEQEHAAEIYRSLSPLGVPSTTQPPSALAKLPIRPEERAVFELLDGRRDVGRIVAMSPLRELNTLKALQKLEALEVIAVARPFAKTKTEA